MENLTALKNAFQSSELFRGLDPSLVRRGFVLSFRRSDEVSETQNGIECVGVILSGSLTVEAAEGSSVSVMKRGGEFGICNIFVRESMPTKLRARVASRILFIPKEEFARLLGADSGLMYRYVKLCNEKMLYLADRLRLVSIPDCTERLLCYLNSKAQDGCVRLGLPKDELARQLGISRASLFRAFNSLEAAGKISVDTGGSIYLKTNHP